MLPRRCGRVCWNSSALGFHFRTGAGLVSHSPCNLSLVRARFLLQTLPAMKPRCLALQGRSKRRVFPRLTSLRWLGKWRSRQQVPQLPAMRALTAVLLRPGAAVGGVGGAIVAPAQNRAKSSPRLGAHRVKRAGECSSVKRIELSKSGGTVETGRCLGAAVWKD